jgi:hypothetical protein
VGDTVQGHTSCALRSHFPRPVVVDSHTVEGLDPPKRRQSKSQLGERGERWYLVHIKDWLVDVKVKNETLVAVHIMDKSRRFPELHKRTGHRH